MSDQLQHQNDRDRTDGAPERAPWNPVQTPGGVSQGTPEERAGEVPADAPQTGQPTPPPPPRPQQPGSQPNPLPPLPNGGQLPQYWTQYTQYQNEAGQFQPDPDYAKLKTVRTQITASNVCGPVSLIVGGVALSTVGIVCAVLAWKNAKRIAETNSPSAPMANNFRKSALVSIVICCIAFVLNAVSAAIMMPAMLDAVSTGDYSQILGVPSTGAEGGASGGTGEGSSAWG